MTELLTTQQAAAFLGLSVWTFRRLVRSGRIPYLRLNARVFRFDEKAITRAFARPARRTT